MLFDFWPGFSYIAFPEWKTAGLIFKRERQRDRERKSETNPRKGLTHPG